MIGFPSAMIHIPKGTMQKTIGMVYYHYVMVEIPLTKGDREMWEG